MFPDWLLPDRPSAPLSTPAGSYKETALELFDEFLRMKNDGVFLDAVSLKMMAAAGIKLPNAVRGDHPPGGFFARPPGSDWAKKVKRQRDTDGLDMDAQCFAIPKDLESDDFICGFDLVMFISAAANTRSSVHLDDLIRKFWLAKICHETPDACDLRQ